MHPFRRLLALGVALGLLTVAAARAADEGEKKVPLDKVPKAVLDAAKAKFEGAEIKGASTEKEDGKLVYEISLIHKGRKIDATFTPEGKVVSVEKEIKSGEVPKPVADALKEKYPRAKVKIAEEVTEDGKVKYEFLLDTGNGEVEAVFDPSGKLLKEEKKEKKEKKDKD
jgi:uncharacterized membrane protein YkoI